MTNKWKNETLSLGFIETHHVAVMLFAELHTHPSTGLM